MLSLKSFNNFLILFIFIIWLYTYTIYNKKKNNNNNTRIWIYGLINEFCALLSSEIIDVLLFFFLVWDLITCLLFADKYFLFVKLTKTNTCINFLTNM